MLTISNPIKGVGRERYYLSWSEDYYLNPLAMAGTWFGGGATRLGLAETIKGDVFRNLLYGFSPDGTRKLAQNSGHANRQHGWDLTLSAPKSVSVYWALSPPLIRLEIERAHSAAVVKTLRRIESKLGITRRGKGGRTKEQTQLLFAIFQHYTSRAHDPQLHAHVLLLNLSFRRDGTTGSIQSIDFFRQKMLLGALYREALAEELSLRLNLAIEYGKVGFHLCCVPKELCRHFSKRGAAILARMNEVGQQGPIAAKQAALHTRGRKEQMPADILFSNWVKNAEALGWTPNQFQTYAISDAAKEKTRPNPELLPARVPKGNLAGCPPSFTTDKARAIPGTTKLQRDRYWEGDRTVSGSDQGIRRNGGRGSKNGGGSRHRDVTRGDARTPKPTRFRSPIWIEWRQMFPRLPKSSARSGWIAPRIVFSALNVPWRWGDVHWSRNLILGDISLRDRRLFPYSPAWSPFKTWKVPALVLGDPIRPEGWGRIQWKKHLILGEIRVQQRIVFPNAPKISPLYKVSVPAFKFAPKSDSWAAPRDGQSQAQAHSKPIGR